MLMPKKTETYEIVPIDPFSKIEKKTENLERDIRDIKEALKGATGFSKIGESANEFISQILNLVGTSQKMIEEVTKSNKEVVNKIKEALEKMNKTNEELSTELTKILDILSRASEITEEEESGMEDLVKAINGLSDSLSKQNNKTQEILESIEKHLKRRTVTQVVPRGAPPYYKPTVPTGRRAPESLLPPPPPPK